MSGNTYPQNTLRQAKSVLGAWSQIGETVEFGSVTYTGFSAEIARSVSISAQIDGLEAQLTDLRNQRNAQLSVVWEQVKRVRSGAKANFGDDSSQYEMVGGTRRSERKPPTRKAKAV